MGYQKFLVLQVGKRIYQDKQVSSRKKKLLGQVLLKEAAESVSALPQNLEQTFLWGFLSLGGRIGWMFWKSCSCGLNFFRTFCVSIFAAVPCGLSPLHTMALVFICSFLLGLAPLFPPWLLGGDIALRKESPNLRETQPCSQGALI